MLSTYPTMAISSILLLVTIFSLIYGNPVLSIEASYHGHGNLQSLTSDSYNNQPYRTAYHFQPPKNWINDPNGPMRYRGLYHMFYQYNPKGAEWGNIVWAHSVSSDLINWIILDHAISPSQPSDINGCWSGSTTILSGGKPVILYTGIDRMKIQVQNLAFPKNLSDPLMREWVKSSKNPLMAPTYNNKINSTSFRDPSTAWLGKDGYWRVLIGSQRNSRGLAILYKSKDFVKWVKAKHPLHSTQGTGMWECPDFYPVLNNKTSLITIGVDTSINNDNVTHVLKVSLDNIKQDYYLIGRYNISKDIFVPCN